MLDNGVVLPAGVIVALELFDNPSELLSSFISNPAVVMTALSNIGSDMSDPVRKKAKKTVVAALAAQVAATASVTASIATRRKN